jgi:hypothetical protein
MQDTLCSPRSLSKLMRFDQIPRSKEIIMYDEIKAVYIGLAGPLICTILIRRANLLLHDCMRS